jgi:hypothetical protein
MEVLVLFVVLSFMATPMEALLLYLVAFKVLRLLPVVVL